MDEDPRSAKARAFDDWKPSILNLKPENRNPKPETRNPKPETRQDEKTPGEIKPADSGLGGKSGFGDSGIRGKSGFGDSGLGFKSASSDSGVGAHHLSKPPDLTPGNAEGSPPVELVQPQLSLGPLSSELTFF